MTEPIFDNADLRWLREGYLSEMPIVQWLAGEAELHLEIGGNSANGVYRRWADRIAGDSFMGDFRRILLPFHEAVKRLGVGPERRWLRAALNWRGLPCLCAHPRLTAHLAAIDGVDEGRVVHGITGSARRVILKIEAGNFDIRRRSSTVHVGHRDSARRVFETVDTDPAQRRERRPRREAEDPRVTHGGDVGGSRSLEKDPPGYVCVASGQWVTDCDCRPIDPLSGAA